MSTGENWPFCVAAQIHISRLGTTSLFPSKSVRAFVSGIGFSYLSIRFQDVSDNFLLLPSVDTIDDANIDRLNLSWSVSPRYWICSRDLPNSLIDIQLRFATLKQLETYLFALSYVRYIHGLSSMSLLSSSLAKARNIVTTADDSYLEDLSDTFIEMRMIRRHTRTMNDLPTEVISHIFLHCAATQDRPDRFAIPLLLLQTCSRWRIIAIGTASLWRGPSFALGRRYFADRDNHLTQMACWLSRAKSSSISLSLAVDDAPYTSDEIFDVARYCPSLFCRVQTLRISAPQSQLGHLLGGHGGGRGPVMATLESLSLVISRWNLQGWSSGFQFCRYSPLRELTIEVGRPLNPVDPSRTNSMFTAAFPWSQLTTITMQLGLGISTWISIFSQCLSLHEACFTNVWNDGQHYSVPSVTFPRLESLRVIFHCFCDTGFFGNFQFPVIQKFHVAGFMASNIHTRPAFMPPITTLRTLLLDVVDLPQRLLQNIVGAHPQVEHLGFFVCGDLVHYSPMLQRLQRSHRIRSLTISMGEDVQDHDLFTTYATRWAVQQAFVPDSEFRLFALKAILDDVQEALGNVGGMEVSIETNVIEPSLSFPYFYSREHFLCVRRREPPFCLASSEIPDSA
ncbi:hypothetical protein B0H11DRAFT_2260564 [Mycena galericulata]|nr:hypothetical protein B0H11DRAFT_2260564 [Mycena galericulata]